jgi:inhibitor of cysteine peptidase
MRSAAEAGRNMSSIEVTTEGSEVEVSVGDEIAVRLPENATTGYQWTVGEAGPALGVESSELVVEPGGAAGSAGQRVVRFRAVQSGHSAVRLTLARAWEPTRPPEEEFEFVVRVR